MKVSVLIRHVSVAIIYKLTWGFMGKGKKGGGVFGEGVHYDSIFLLLLLPLPC